MEEQNNPQINEPIPSSSKNIWVAVIISIVITAIVVGGGVYFWQKYSLKITEQNLQQQIVSLQSQVEQLEGQDADQLNINPDDNLPIIDTKTFEDKNNNFSFFYPAKYIKDGNGLWTQERYENRNLIANITHIPNMEIITEKLLPNQTLEQFIIQLHDRPGNTLEEMHKITKDPYEYLTIGKNEFIKVILSDLHKVTAYYVVHNNTVVGFETIFEDSLVDSKELEEIASSLKFE